MPKPVVILIALICFAAPVFVTVVSHGLPTQPEEKIAPSDLRGKVLFFSASWCGACTRSQPAYEKLRNAGYPIRKVDVDSNPTLSQKYGIRSIPQFVYVVDGQEVRRMGGTSSPDRLKRIYRQSAW